MIFLIDGYNLLFKLCHCQRKIQAQRNFVIQFLQEKFSFLKLKAKIIFDGHYKDEPLATREYRQNLNIIYTPQNQSADDYILERIFLSKIPSQITVISSDKALQQKALELTAKSQSIDDFLTWLDTKEKKQKKEENAKSDFLDTKKELKRLLKIFEEKLSNNLDNWN